MIKVRPKIIVTTSFEYVLAIFDKAKRIISLVPVLPTLPVTGNKLAVDLVLAFLAIFSKASKTLLTFARAILLVFLIFSLIKQADAPLLEAELTKSCPLRLAPLSAQINHLFYLSTIYFYS